jgi:hypothetical protein
LEALRTLKLDNNQFDGIIPVCIGSLVLLRNLDLSKNDLTGELPIEICDLLNLEEMLIYNTHIEGRNLFFNSKGYIPECIGALTKLVEFDISDNRMYGTVPESIGKLVLLERFYLGKEENSNEFVGPLPSSMSNLILLEKIYLNVATLNGTVPDFSQATFLTKCAFTPSKMCIIPEFVPVNSNCDFSVIPFCKSVDLTSSQDLTQPIDSSTIIESPTETPAPQASKYQSNGNLPLILGATSVGLLILLSVILAMILFKRREQGKESDIELRLLPKYSSTNKQIRLMKMLNSGGFGVVWKARYKGQTVAIKLIRMDKYIGRGKEHERKIQTAKIVVDEASIMGLMIHERIVRFIMFEIESLGIVLEYLPLGSLYDYIANRNRVMPWAERYQMMLDICEGMEFLHSNVYAGGKMKKVLFHQDFKSGNVLLCMEGTPASLRGKISDFGLSCKLLVILTHKSSLERHFYKTEFRSK